VGEAITIRFGVRWGGLRWGGTRRGLTLLTPVLLALAALTSTSSQTAAATAGETTSVIVRELAGSGDGPEQAVAGLGGTVGRHIGIIDGFVADVPEGRLARLETATGVHSVTRNARVRLNGSLDGWDHTHDHGSMYFVAQEVTGVGEYWNNGYTGQGVDVALIDSGVVPVDGLSAPDKVVHGADLSFESQSDDLRNLDTFGHGTHMAGIVAGRDGGTPSPVQKGESDHFVGMAPDARIVSVKVADAYGIADTSQVIAAIDWVVQHRTDNGMNIRVLNLSFGTDGTQNYKVDPLAYAAEVAWRKGIVVVVSAGNGGWGTSALNNPAYDPFVIAVGGADGKGTYDYKDDVVPEWSSFGDGTRNPDLVAPGKSVVSLRAPGSSIDLENPQGLVASRFFRGSGTSQAAAVVSGAAALIIQQRPSITPNQVKKLLTSTARTLPAADVKGQGAGMIDLKVARDTATPSLTASAQLFALSTGAGSLELTRGSDHLDDGTAVLTGEMDIFGAVWNGAVWAPASLAGTTWTGGLWNGNRWSGDTWSGNRWSGNRWSGNRWDSTVWSGNRWDGNRWDGNRWSGNRWSGNRWSGNRWSGAGWGG